MRLSKEKPLVSGQEKILLIGASGQIGRAIKPLLETLYPGKIVSVSLHGNFGKGAMVLDVTDTGALSQCIKDHHIEVVVNMAGLRSSMSEAGPEAAQEVNYAAVKRLIEASDALGVKQVFTPSSIAVYGTDAGLHATMQSPLHPCNVYGRTKMDLEHFMRDWNAKGKGAFATSLRIGGVLSCKMPPSSGVAKEFDKLIIAAAYQRQMGQPYSALADYYENGIYYPKIPADSKIPFIFIDDAAREIVRYIHNVTRDDPNATRHHLAGFTLNMQELLTRLKTLSQGRFHYNFSNASENSPAAQSIRQSPVSLDMGECVRWGYNADALTNADRAISICFQRVSNTLKHDVARINP